MKRIQSYFKKMAQPFLWAFYQWYLSKSRLYQYKDLKVTVLPSVFYPGWLGSTKAMLQYLLQLDLKHKHLLELGTGSGLISLVAAKLGAKVTATDINPMAVASIRESTKINGLAINVFESDLFDNITPQDFDYIIINPPYYPKNPSDLRQLAFYCGENFEFFNRLFKELKPYLISGSTVLMVLSESCDLERIRSCAGQRGIELDQEDRIKKFWEWHYIFRVTKAKTV